MPLDPADTSEGHAGTDAESDRQADAEGDSPAEGTGDRPAEGDSDRPADATDTTAGGREVEVPMRVYKSVTVFSTLIAVVSVLGGFLLLDQATNRARLPASEVDLPLAVAGLGAILLGAAVYAYSTRFRAAGMGTPKDDAGKEGDNG